jgi:hypothetical protein
MKKSIITLVLVILSNLVTAQSYYNAQTEFFHTKLTNGLGFEKMVNFRLSKSDYEAIKKEKKDVIKYIDDEINLLLSQLTKNLSMDFIDNKINNIKFENGIDVTLVYTANRYGNNIVNSYSTHEMIKDTERVTQEKAQVAKLISIETQVKEEESKRQLEEIAAQTAELKAKAKKMLDKK